MSIRNFGSDSKNGFVLVSASLFTKNPEKSFQIILTELSMNNLTFGTPKMRSWRSITTCQDLCRLYKRQFQTGFCDADSPNSFISTKDLNIVPGLRTFVFLCLCLQN